MFVPLAFANAPPLLYCQVYVPPTGEAVLPLIVVPLYGAQFGETGAVKLLLVIGHEQLLFAVIRAVSLQPLFVQTKL